MSSSLALDSVMQLSVSHSTSSSVNPSSERYTSRLMRESSLLMAMPQSFSSFPPRMREMNAYLSGFPEMECS